MASDGAPRPRSHALGDFGERLVTFLLPDEWVIHSYKGSEDYGIDLHVEIFREGNPTGLEFGVQVKSVERFHPKKKPSVKLTSNNIAYMASKAFPTMIAIASKKEKTVRFSWLQDILKLDELAEMLSPDRRRKTTLLHLKQYEELTDDVTSIVDKASLIKAEIAYWLRDEANRQSISDLYFNLHAGLDALIEIKCKPAWQEFSEEEWSHKITYTFSLVGANYFLLFFRISNRLSEEKDSSLRAVFAVISRLRELMIKIVPEEHIRHHETEPSSETDDFLLHPANTTILLREADQFICVFRDILREISRFVAPWRDFSMGTSGLANSIIEFESK